MLSKTSSQVIKAFIEIGRLQEDVSLGAGVLAQRIGAPGNYLGKVLQTYTFLGLLESRKGAGGGFRLKKPAGKIHLLDIVEPIEKISSRPQCALGMKRCSDINPCVLHSRWSRVRESYMSFLKTTTLADLTR